MTAGNPYGGVILEHFRRPRNYGTLPNATAESEGSNPLCGDRVRVAVVLDAGQQRIEDARFTANACAICVASASLLTERMRGATLETIAAITADDIVSSLGAEVPAARRTCATLPLEAARSALATARGATGAESRPRSQDVVALLLAAGSARRFGGPQKLLAEVSDSDAARPSLVRLAAVLLQRAGVRRLLVVVGREGDRVREGLRGVEAEVVTNPLYGEGMSTSVTTGIRAALDRWPEAAGLLVALGDQPLLDGRIVPSLVAAFESAAGARIVAPRYRGQRGNPVLFSRELVEELLAISGDQGARAVIERDPSRVRHVDFDIDAPIDVDTPEDVARLGRALEARQTGG